MSNLMMAANLAAYAAEPQETRSLAWKGHCSVLSYDRGPMDSLIIKYNAVCQGADGCQEILAGIRHVAAAHSAGSDYERSALGAIAEWESVLELARQLEGDPTALAAAEVEVAHWLWLNAPSGTEQVARFAAAVFGGNDPTEQRRLRAQYEAEFAALRSPNGWLSHENWERIQEVGTRAAAAYAA